MSGEGDGTAESLSSREQELRESESKFRQIIETMPSMLWSAAPDGQPTYINQRILDYSGLSLQSFQNLGWKEFLHPEDFPETARAFYNSIQTGDPYEAEHRLRRADGQYRWHHARGEPLRDREGRIIQWYGLSVDIDDRKCAEQALLEEHEQQTAISEVLRAIAASPGDLKPIFDAILDSATRLCRADVGTMRLYEGSGLRRVAIRGDPLFVSQASSSLPALAEMGSHIGRIAKSRLPTHIPDLPAYEGDLRDDLLITTVNMGILSSLWVPLHSDNEIIGTIALGRKQVRPFTDKQISLFRDFAAQATIVLESTRRERQYREMLSELAHANRVATMGQLTASIAHEVRQPIATTRNNARAALNFLDKRPPDVTEVREALACIVNDADRASDILDRIGSLIKKAPTRKELVDLNAAILEVIAVTHGEAVKIGVTVDTQLAGALPRIQGDRVQLQQVMLNLIVNSIQSMSGVENGNRELRISTVSIEPGGVCVAVQDTGRGLRPETLPHLFEPFYTTKPDGMGMGLSICRSIIEAHGGRLWANANEPQGAVFQFTLPNSENS
jgi:PAS domain S-box-containing protein